MSADLHLHVRTSNITDDVLRSFFRNSLGSHWGPKNLDDIHHAPYDPVPYDTIARTPDIWIGSVSWLKAALFDEDGGDSSEFIPDPVATIADLVGDSADVTITPELIERICQALEGPNESVYQVASVDTVRPWLEQYQGQAIFCVSW